MTPEGKSRKQTRRWVLIADRLADRAISAGGILVIAAVIGMMVFLIFEVIPLFKAGQVLSHKTYQLNNETGRAVSVTMDEYKTLSATLSRDGSVRLLHARSGTLLKPVKFDFGGREATAISAPLDGPHLAFGFANGTVRLGKLDFRVDILSEAQLPSGLTKIDDTDSTDGAAVYSAIPGRGFRKIALHAALEDEITVAAEPRAVVGLDYRYSDFGERPRKALAMLFADGTAKVIVAESKLNLFTRKSKVTLTEAILPAPPGAVDIKYVLATDNGEEVYLAEESGRVFRYDVRDFAKPMLAEQTSLTPPGVRISSLGFLLGRRSLVVGGSDGSVRIFFLLAREKALSEDGKQLVNVRELEKHATAVVAFSAGTRGKTFATADVEGNLWIRQGTTGKTLFKFSTPDGAVGPMALSPRMDGLLALSGNNVNYWDLYAPHPEISWGALFGKIWYEGYPEPSYTWQSAGATDEFEPKLSLIPLIFGTIKATFYSLLFAVPIALSAAVYTSEFLPPRIRGKVKPVIEIMASIPSVALGFVAALALSPIVETWIAAVVLAFVAAPVSLIAMAYLWQLLPSRLAVRFEGIPKFLIIVLTLVGSLYATVWLGPAFERLFFAGNFIQWTNGSVGRAAPFLFLLLTPVSAFIVSSLASRYYGRRFQSYLRGKRMPYGALIDLARWLAVAGASAGAAFCLAMGLEAIGFDPRGDFVGSYVQRNTLIVGFAMGFAVIPIIYTLAEDALNSVPEHLRSASLGCGATPWQTAKWIILPTALSGVFSAVMIGMGRAVGETMIVVMSAGNTPIIDWNIFNGLRALSANIAVELPEAPKDGSLYRVLFLTGLVLFGITFVINTAAELVRMRFRKRTGQL